jgi:phospholipid/cholesterol/gamma-HCH transport system substrate-binding protein
VETKASRARTLRIGLVILAVFAAAVIAIFSKPAIVTGLRPGETVELEFARDYKVEPYLTAVKVAGSRVGVVSDVDGIDGGGVRLSLKLDNGTREILGTEPTAEIRPTTVLGGKYYVSLTPGGERGTFQADGIPRERTRTPVELDSVMAAIPPAAQKGLQGMTERLDSTFEAGAGNSLATLLESAPGTLQPAGVTLEALRGSRPDTDLLRAVSDLNRTAEVLIATPGQLRSVVDSLAGTSKVLGDNAGPVTETISTLPDVLRATRAGSAKLAFTLDKVTDTAADARPAVRELDPLLRELDPALAELRPVLTDLRPLLEDAQPLVEQLTPTVAQGTSVLHDVHGPVLDRVNGPITEQLLTEWHGEAPKYPNGGGTGNKFYEELGYMFAHINNAVQNFDATAHLLPFQPGAGTSSVTGTGDAAQDLQNELTRMWGPPHQEPPLQLPPAGGVQLPDATRGNGG